MDTSKELDYGAVAIVGGKYKDQVGYYDDDDDEGNKAIVYFGVPFMSPYVLISKKHLRNVTSLDHEKFKRLLPEFCETMGIP